MKHPTDDILLAYMRNQQGHWQADTQDHITTCILCSRRCAELQHIGHTIEGWADDYRNDAAYALVSKRVLRSLHTAQPTRFTRPRIHLSVMMVFAVFCLVLLIGFTAQLPGSFARSINMWGSFPIVPSHMATKTPQVLTPTRSSIGGAGTAARPTIVTTCTKDADVKEHHLHVCGSNFTADSSVTIKYTLPDGKIKKHNAQVGKNGTFIDTLRINSCSDIPVAIDATNMKYSSEVVHFKQFIEFGNC